MKKIISGLLVLVSNICLAADQEMTQLINSNSIKSPKIHQISQLLDQHPELDVTDHIKQTKNQMCDDCLQVCFGCGTCLYGLIDCCATLNADEPRRETYFSTGIITTSGAAVTYASSNLFIHGATLGRLNQHNNKEKTE